MDKKILVSMMVIGLVATLAGAGLYAYFSDTETSTGNTFTAGTLDLTVNDENGVNVVVFTATDLKPGDSGSGAWTLKNIGSITGTLTMSASYTADENSLVEPELALGDTGDDDDGADLDGELDENMVFDLYRGATLLVDDGTIAAVVAALNAESQSMASGDTIVYTLEWSIPSGVDNIIQSDDIILSITFTLTQS